MRCPSEGFNIGVVVRAFAVLVLAPAFAFGAAAGAVGIVGGVSTPVAKPTSLVWNARVFTSRADLAGWLRGRGVTYETWAKRHPAAARVLDDRANTADPQNSGASVPLPRQLLAVLTAAVAVLAAVAALRQPSIRGSAVAALSAGNFSLAAIREAASTPQGRRTLGRLALYAASAVLTVGLGAAVALYVA